MKGLLLKDWYVAKKHCRMYPILTIGFLVLSFVQRDNYFFVFYPCILCGMLPVNLLAYDEQGKWDVYSGTLPYTKAQLVSVKYLMGLLTQAVVVAATAVFQMIAMHRYGTFSMEEYLALLCTLVMLSCLSNAISLPFMFRFGVEKGRLAYLVMIGVVCAGGLISSDVMLAALEKNTSPLAIMGMGAAVSVLLYALSWVLSIKLYQKREI